jgi:homeobox protein cut-like
MRSLERELNTLKKDRDGLKEKMHQWSDYDNLKRELEVLKVCSRPKPKQACSISY